MSTLQQDMERLRAEVRNLGRAILTVYEPLLRRIARWSWWPK